MISHCNRPYITIRIRLYLHLVKILFLQEPTCYTKTKDYWYPAFFIYIKWYAKSLRGQIYNITLLLLHISFCCIKEGFFTIWTSNIFHWKIKRRSGWGPPQPKGWGRPGNPWKPLPWVGGGAPEAHLLYGRGPDKAGLLLSPNLPIPSNHRFFIRTLDHVFLPKNGIKNTLCFFLLYIDFPRYYPCLFCIFS